MDKNNPNRKLFYKASVAFALASEAKDAKAMKEAYDEITKTKLGRKNNYLFEVSILITEKKYKEALELLEKNEPPKAKFVLVTEAYLKGKTCLALGFLEEGKKNIDFVISNGNTMPCVKKAKKLLNH